MQLAVLHLAGRLPSAQCLSSNSIRLPTLLERTRLGKGDIEEAS